MRRIPRQAPIFLPSFVLNMDESLVEPLWSGLHEFCNEFPEWVKGMGKRDLLDAMMEVESKELLAMLFSLGFATARIWRCSELSSGMEAPEYIANLFIQREFNKIGALCISPLAPKPNDYVYKYELRAVNRPKDGQSQDGSDRIWTYYSKQYESLYGSGTGWCMIATKVGALWQAELFTPGQNVYIVYCPGLQPAEANICALAFNGLRAGMTANVYDGHLYPLMLPVDIRYFGTDSPLPNCDALRLADLLCLRKSLTAAWFEWQLVNPPFSEADFVDTGKIADKVIDVNRPGEWCLVDPNGRVFCNPLRQTTTVPFGNSRDAAMLTLSAEALASATFQWLLGTELAANMVEVADGFFRVGVPRLHIYVSLASNEDELVTHALAMENKPGVKVVIITALLDSEAQKGIVALRRICPDYAYSTKTRHSVYTNVQEWRRALRNHHLSGKEDPKFGAFAQKNMSLMMRLYPDVSRWERMVEVAVTPSVIVTEQGIPKAPEGYGWEDLTIEVGFLNGAFFVRTWFTHRETMRVVARSRKIHAALIEGFGSRSSVTGVSKLFHSLVRVIRGAHERKKAAELALDRHSYVKRLMKKRGRRKALTDAQRTQRHELKKLLQRFLGLPDTKGFVSKEGIPCFTPVYSPGFIGSVHSRKQNSREDAYSDWLLSQAPTTDITGCLFEGDPEDAPRPEDE